MMGIRLVWQSSASIFSPTPRRWRHRFFDGTGYRTGWPRRQLNVSKYDGIVLCDIQEEAKVSLLQIVQISGIDTLTYGNLGSYCGLPSILSTFS